MRSIFHCIEDGPLILQSKALHQVPGTSSVVFYMVSNDSDAIHPSLWYKVCKPVGFGE